jgi:PAS domain S-box-containing protein
MIKEVMNNENTELTETILGCIGDGVISTDMNGRINYMNEAAETITGFMAEDAIGKLFDSLMTIFDAATGKPHESPISRLFSVTTSIGMENNAAVKTKQGQIKYLSANCTFIKGKDRSRKGIVIVFRDISRLKQLKIILWLFLMMPP